MVASTKSEPCSCDVTVHSPPSPWWSEPLKVGLAPSVTVLIFCIGLWQYRTAQKWKRTEFAAAMLKELNADEDLKACCFVLDYPSRCVVLEDRKDSKRETTILMHERRKLRDAMVLEPPRPKFTEEQIIYRDLFDRLFTYFAQVEHACAQHLIKPGFVRPLHYWLEKILVVRDEGDIFGPFIAKYHPSVLKLAIRFEHEGLLDSRVHFRIEQWQWLVEQMQPGTQVPMTPPKVEVYPTWGWFVPKA
jgi:hypothetical protein